MSNRWFDIAEYYRIFIGFPIQCINCSRGEMDITTVFGTVIVGSSPAGSTKVENWIVKTKPPVILGVFLWFQVLEKCC
jgi:hypothetical protein